MAENFEQSDSRASPTDSPNRDPTPRFGESRQKSGTSGPATRLAKATQGRPNSTQPARSAESLRPDKPLGEKTHRNPFGNP
ncbi:hypothetical protein PCANC_12890 [Puccinia coronata f. sp. avenae]|uniref:Uncharacterized protein n=1 Tax=Puccinia coronata f. sp. avenae TaxID=200324 RepID=A0A2N5VE72_9BASI|nr:hypothetical protein PCANC_12890 [Puccinia coronata f. sp. avenae]